MATILNPNISFLIDSFHNWFAICTVKLKPSNYLVWRTQITQLMQAMTVQNLVTKEPPFENTVKDDDKVKANPQFLERQETDALIRSWFLRTMTSECLYLVVVY